MSTVPKYLDEDEKNMSWLMGICSECNKIIQTEWAGEPYLYKWTHMPSINSKCSKEGVFEKINENKDFF